MLIAACAAAPALAAPARDAAPVLASASDTFRAIEFPSADGLKVLTWADDVLRRMEAQLDHPLPAFSGQPVQIVARTGTQGPARVVKAQGWVDGYLVQKLILSDPSTIDQEDMLSGLCWLLLNRYAIAHQSVAQRKDALAVTPDWFSVGLAQSLFPSLRERQFDVVLERRGRGEEMTIEQILAKQYLPAGRWSEKDECGVLVDWLMDTDGSRPVIGDLSRVWAAGQKVTARWVARRLGFKALGAAELAWSEWVAGHEPFTRTMGVVEPERVAALRRILADACGDRALAGWIPLRGDPRLGRRLERVETELESVALGAPTDFREVIERYQVFFRELADSERSGTMSNADLRLFLEETGQARIRIEDRVRERMDYLDRVGARLDQQGAQPTRAGHYLDGVERRLGGGGSRLPLSR
jgi:hypothetical protein